ncbi:molecular chaperone HtpG [Desulfobaculum xiamenense]|uniref:Chaperone protein HtpG n=1 Tax=Desulfobaculum xiamenense TaxID=995050 RepID=A0A846QL90_9BACT|nr:molecular chaperone HtpG [Desulfobaculum xiamenense]NJB68938.1 molecular chaperone HtpG [Desulfobaculum xiamenense]
MATNSTHTFKAEITQLLDIITNSIYTNRDIFLRELVSNASDAMDKVRFLSASGTELADAEAELRIDITCDKDAHVITVADTGIGMTSEELVENIGTIAHSGSATFMAEAAKNGTKADSIIGRFGVGFYSVFMVAREVSITTRSGQPGATPVVWTSTGTGSYTIAEAEGDNPRGTTIRITLKDEATEFADPERLRSIIREHSNFVSFPIFVDGERVNTQPALWREPKFQITKEQYDDFYTFLTYDSKAPQDTLHIAVDAPVQFNALLFVPDMTSGNFFNDPEKYGLDLYVRRVLIARRHKDLIPQYLGFMRGVVDTEDLPLNISRETLQENLLIGKIRSTVTKQVLARLTKLAQDDADAYANFWRNHHKVFKLGYGDYANRDAFADLLRFNSSADADAEGLTSLADYVSRMKDGQKDIYFISGTSREAIRLNPHGEIFRRKGIEVLYLYEPIDEFILDALRQYKDHDLVAAEQADMAALDAFADAEDTAAAPEALGADDERTFEDMIATMKSILGERVEDVRISRRLKDSPACLVSPDGGMSSQMQKMLQIMSKDTTPPVKILEINRDHAMARNLLRIFKKDRDDAFFRSATEHILESALLQEGYLDDPHALVARMNELLEKSSGWYAEIRHV